MEVISLPHAHESALIQPILKQTDMNWTKLVEHPDVLSNMVNMNAKLSHFYVIFKCKIQSSFLSNARVQFTSKYQKKNENSTDNNTTDQNYLKWLYGEFC